MVKKSKSLWKKVKHTETLIRWQSTINPNLIIEAEDLSQISGYVGDAGEWAVMAVLNDAVIDDWRGHPVHVWGKQGAITEIAKMKPGWEEMLSNTMGWKD